VESDPLILHGFLQRFARHIHGPSVLFPTTDTALLTVATLQETLAPHVTWMPDRHIVETMVFKDRFYRSLQQYDVPHPYTCYLDEHDPETLAQTLVFPVFLRPAQSLLFYQRLGGKGFVTHTIHEFRHYLELTQRTGLTMMVQEIIPGPTECGFALRGYIDAQGRVTALMATQKIRQPALISNVMINRTVPLSRLGEMLTVFLTYLQQIGYRGLFGAEFKRDPQDGQLKLLEVNARSLGGNYFAVQCGMNHVRMAYEDALGHPVTPATGYTKGVYKIHLSTDPLLLFEWAVRGRLHATDLQPYIHPWVGHYYTRDDPLPFLQVLRHTLDPRTIARYLQRS
jgi:predicted ATP-grasp superfamily ATP-dependent carboligase